MDETFSRKHGCIKACKRELTHITAQKLTSQRTG
jgi:hypothetical protein